MATEEHAKVINVVEQLAQEIFIYSLETITKQNNSDDFSLHYWKSHI